LGPARSVRYCNQTRLTSALTVGRLRSAGRARPLALCSPRLPPPSFVRRNRLGQPEMIDRSFLPLRVARAPQRNLTLPVEVRRRFKARSTIRSPESPPPRAPLVIRTADSPRRTAKRLYLSGPSAPFTPLPRSREISRARDTWIALTPRLMHTRQGTPSDKANCLASPLKKDDAFSTSPTPRDVDAPSRRTGSRTARKKWPKPPLVVARHAHHSPPP
jgi:hypothetical protein